MFSSLPPVVSGVSTHTEELGKRLVERGHEVHVISFLNDEGDYDLNGINVHGLSSYYDLADLYSVKTPLCIPEIEELLTEINPDILHMHHRTSLVEFFPDKLKEVSEAPLISTVHCSSGDVYPTSFKNPFYYLHYKAMSNVLEDHSDEIISVSQYNKEKLIENGVSEDKVEVIKNGVDPEGFDKVSRKEGREMFDIGEKEKIILFTGRLSSEKGLHYLISGFKDLEEENVSLKICGDGPLKNVYKIQGKTDSRIEFMGELHEKELTGIYKASDVFVFPSTNPEPQGISLLEAMASELPVIASDIGGIPEVVNEDCGILVEAKSSNEITQALRDLIKNSERRERLGKNGRSYVENNHDWEEITSKTEKVYKRATA